jgi:hypothetical protein
VHITPEDKMRFKHAGRARAAIAVAAAVALAAAASPAVAQVHIGVGPAVVVAHPGHSDGSGVERRAERLRGRYQLRLDHASKLLSR